MLLESRMGRSAALLLGIAVALTACLGEPANRRPIAAFDAVPLSGTAPLMVTFDASASRDPDGVVLAYDWDLGDGTLRSDAQFVHVFDDPGLFVVRLLVSDEWGAHHAMERTIEVVPTPATISGALDVHLQPEVAAAGGFGAAPVIPGEWIVQFTPGTVTLASSGAWLHQGRTFTALRRLGLPDTLLMRTEPTDAAETAVLTASLNDRADVVFAEPNHRVEAFEVPNDPRYPQQWSLPAIGLPHAWAVTTGSPQTVVAVVDTGILHDPDDDARTHPDLRGRVLPGFDFIVDPVVANDGDGRDDDPFDAGDGAGWQASYHGSHVAGILAAASNDEVGIAGIDWAAMILPVRVLGVGGGSMADVIDGTLWAAGFDVPGVPTNRYPADVINLSLGAPCSCTRAEQTAFDLIRTAAPRNAVVVVAAGNDGVNAYGTSPASCDHVVTVGATTVAGARAGYSNYGAAVELMAPGGGTGGLIVSLTRQDATGTFGYAWMCGTSMATPHVSGVAALLKALDPDATAGMVEALLTTSAVPLTEEACGVKGGCGSGALDAAGAIALAFDGPLPWVDGSVNPTLLAFGDAATERIVTLTNGGSVGGPWTFDGVEAAVDNPGTMPPGTIALPPDRPTSGTLEGSSCVTLPFLLDRERPDAAGTFHFTLSFTIDTIPLQVVGSFTIPEPRGPLVVRARAGGTDGPIVAVLPLERTAERYTLATPPGIVVLEAWSDENRDGLLGVGDLFGRHGAVIDVRPGEALAGIDITLERVGPAEP